MGPRPNVERTKWQQVWPWLAGVSSLVLQGLTFTAFYWQIWPSWGVAYLTPLMTLPLVGPFLLLVRPAAWSERPVRRLRALVLSSAVAWLVLSGGGVFLTLALDGMKVGAELRASERRDRGEIVPTGPPRLYSTLQIPRLPQGWAFIFWGAFSVIGAAVITRFQDAKDEVARQRLNAALAQDAALRAKLAPHFIFNALNTLHAQIEHDARGAQATTERLARLFRQVIQVSEHATIPLKQELAFVEGYLGIEKARLGERLQVEIEVPEDLESQGIPPLSLQVLVENAIKHGVGSLEAGGRVRISARREDRGLVLTVEDPGNGRGAGTGTGTALETLRARLAHPQDLVMGPCEGGYRASFRWRQS